jgi:RimJ/RimL family protein N-acetyltransferase
LLPKPADLQYAFKTLSGGLSSQLKIPYYARIVKRQNSPVKGSFLLTNNLNEEDGKPWLGSLVIDKYQQRQKLASEIFQCLVEHLRQHTDWTILRAGVKAQNEAGLVFLKSMGLIIWREGSGRFATGVQPFLLMEFAL